LPNIPEPYNHLTAVMFELYDILNNPQTISSPYLVDNMTFPFTLYYNLKTSYFNSSTLGL